MFEAGLYYVGDLCYYLRDEWNEVCDLTINGNSALDGEFTLADGRKFAMYGTAYGDGTYFDQSGREYWVDSGTIGCIMVSEDQEPISGGNLIKFNSSFTTDSNGSVIDIGNISIDTNPEDEDDEDDYNADDYEDQDEEGEDDEDDEEYELGGVLDEEMNRMLKIAGIKK